MTVSFRFLPDSVLLNDPLSPLPETRFSGNYSLLNTRIIFFSTRAPTMINREVDVCPRRPLELVSIHVTPSDGILQGKCRTCPSSIRVKKMCPNSPFLKHISPEVLAADGPLERSYRYVNIGADNYLYSAKTCKNFLPVLETRLESSKRMT